MQYWQLKFRQWSPISWKNHLNLLNFLINYDKKAKIRTWAAITGPDLKVDILTSPIPSPSPMSKPQIQKGKGEFGLWAVFRILAQNAGGKTGAKLFALC